MFPLVALLVYGYEVYSIWVVATFLFPALALQRLIHLYQEQREAVARLAAVNHQLERANLSFASALGRHSRRPRPIHGRPLGGCRGLLA